MTAQTYRIKSHLITLLALVPAMLVVASMIWAQTP